MAPAKVFESKKAAYLLHKEAAKQSKAGAKATSRTVNQQAYWNHVSKYLKSQGGRGGIKDAADSWANVGYASAAEKTAKGKAAKATKANASAAKQYGPNAKQRKLGVTTTIQDKEKAKKAQKKFTAKEKADKAKADKVWTAFRASGAK